MLPVCKRYLSNEKRLSSRDFCTVFKTFHERLSQLQPAGWKVPSCAFLNAPSCCLERSQASVTTRCLSGWGVGAVRALIASCLGPLAYLRPPSLTTQDRIDSISWTGHNGQRCDLQAAPPYITGLKGCWRVRPCWSPIPPCEPNGFAFCKLTGAQEKPSYRSIMFLITSSSLQSWMKHTPGRCAFWS